MQAPIEHQRGGRSDGPAVTPAGGHAGHAVFEILAREHADMLTAYLRSLVGDTETVDELFQQTLVTAWRRLDDYDRSRPFGPWLRGIAAKLTLAYRRKQARGATAVAPEVLEALDRRFERLGAMPGDSFRERAERLLGCLGRLPEKLREAVELVYARGLLIKEAAASVDAAEEAVKKRVQRARALLAQCLLSVEGEHERTA